MAFAAFADAPVDVAVDRGRASAAPGTPPTSPTATVAVVTPVALDHTAYLGDTVGAIAAEKAGIIKPGAVAVLAAQQPRRRPRLLQRRAAEVARRCPPRAWSSASPAATWPSAASGSRCPAWAGSYQDLFLPLFGAHQAQNAACALAAVEAFWAGAGPLDEELVSQAFAAVTVAGAAGGGAAQPGGDRGLRAQPGGHGRQHRRRSTEAFGFETLVAVLAVSADKDVPGMLAELEPAVSSLVVTRNSAARSMDPGELERLAAQVFGPDRVFAAPRLDDAIDTATALADEAADGAGRAGAGILITGSTTTAGEARLLLGAAGAGQPAGGGLGGETAR